MELAETVGEAGQFCNQCCDAAFAAYGFFVFGFSLAVLIATKLPLSAYWRVDKYETDADKWFQSLLSLIRGDEKAG